MSQEEKLEAGPRDLIINHQTKTTLKKPFYAKKVPVVKLSRKLRIIFFFIVLPQEKGLSYIKHVVYTCFMNIIFHSVFSESFGDFPLTLTLGDSSGRSLMGSRVPDYNLGEGPKN